MRIAAKDCKWGGMPNSGGSTIYFKIMFVALKPGNLNSDIQCRATWSDSHAPSGRPWPETCRGYEINRSPIVTRKRRVRTEELSSQI